jgi:hypothetical protein
MTTKIRTSVLIAIFLISSLLLPVDSYSKGGGRGGGKGGGGGSAHGHGGGDHGHSVAGFQHFRGGVILDGYGYSSYWGSTKSGCQICHPSLKFFDRFRSCPYTNRMKGTGEKGMVGTQIRNQPDGWPSATFFIGP